MAAEGGSGSSSRERTTSGQRAKNERRTISKFPASIDLRQVFFFILPNIRTAFLSPPLVTFYLPRSTRDGESGSVSRPHFRPSIFPAPRLSARLSAPRLSQPLDFPPLKFPSPSTFRPSTSPAAASSHTADLPPPLKFPPAFPPLKFPSPSTRRPTSHSLNASFSATNAVCAHTSPHPAAALRLAAVRASPASSPPPSCGA